MELLKLGQFHIVGWLVYKPIRVDVSAIGFTAAWFGLQIVGALQHSCH